MKTTSQEKYDKLNTIHISLKLNKKTDKDIIEAIGTENKQGTIKKLIRKGLNK